MGERRGSVSGLLRQLERRPLLLLAGIPFALALAVNLLLVYAASRQGYLSGEETTATIVNPVLARQRLQCNHYTSFDLSNIVFGAVEPVGYRIAGLEWLRIVKALATAATPALLAVTAHRRLRVRPWIALWVGAAAALTCALFSFSWLAIEAGLDVLPGLVALLVATQPLTSGSATRPWARALLVGVLLGASVSLYAGGIAFWPACAVAIALWPDTAPLGRRIVRAAAGDAVAIAAGAAVIVLCAYYFSNAHDAPFGGGTQAATDLGANARALWDDVIGSSHSYYFLSTTAAVSIVTLLLGFAGVVRGTRDVMTGLLALVAVTSVVLAIVSSPPGGIRRALAAVAVLVLFAGVALEHLASTRRSPAELVAAGVAGLALLFGAASAYSNFHALERDTLVLPHDFTFTFLPGKGMSETVAAIDATFPDSVTAAEYEPDRLAALLLARRESASGDTATAWTWWHAHATQCQAPPAG